MAASFFIARPAYPEHAVSERQEMVRPEVGAGWSSTRGNDAPRDWMARNVRPEDGRDDPDRPLRRPYRGKLFELEGYGFYDLDGFWCVYVGTHKVEVRRNAPKRMTGKLSRAQKDILHNARMRAARAGTR